jgi:hypothetical protein
MSVQYAKKKISDIQKSITFWELECIHDWVKMPPISVGEIVHSNENEKIKINFDLEIPKSEDAIRHPMTGYFRTENISNNKTKVWLLKYQNSIDQVHLWEIYYAKRKRIITESFIFIFIVLFISLLYTSPYIFEWLPLQKKNGYMMLETTNDPLLKRNQFTENFLYKNSIVKIKINSEITIRDTSIVKNSAELEESALKNGQFSQKEENFKSSRNRGIISAFGAFYFFLLYPFMSLWLCRKRIKMLIGHLFGNSLSKYVNPNEN